MRDVAQRAGVSISTVSFVVNDTKPVAPATRARIEAAMIELGYRRNAFARALASSRSSIVAIAFPALEHRLGATAMSIVTSASVAAAERGFNLVMWPVSNDASQLEDYIGSGLVDGLLLMEVQQKDPRVALVEERGLPYLLIGRTEDSSQQDYVDMDFERTVTDAMDHLTGLGHREIALVVGSLGDNTLPGYGPIVRTEAAYRRRVASLGLRDHVVACEQTPVAGRDAARRILDEVPSTTAVIVLNDDAASGVVRGMERAGRAVPDDVSVFSVATSPDVVALADPTLSALMAPGREMGRRAVDGLLDRLENPTVPRTQVLVPCELALAGSTGPAPAPNR
ncbi:LacI family transcriptional regulator [Paraoerskovia sediminicola]|uniref:LacI family transcriptional regulator n=2 Tax=Paraoerskovia sediminicola TaxID=1138587 RepID=A0ABM8G6D0_9CELL|nr:LacI family transcriptional regulator [Paraoerskovia sediminicola]